MIKNRRLAASSSDSIESTHQADKPEEANRGGEGGGKVWFFFLSLRDRRREKAGVGKRRRRRLLRLRCRSNESGGYRFFTQESRR